ncbi:CCA tRNA nucleotidyltransferase [bacterium]|nr:CCA tRNA nucleotidyltransferase [bacterium]
MYNRSMDNKMLEGAIKVLKKFEEEQYEAYIVGGFVRDYLLDMDAYDIDITTNCLPDEIERIFPDSFVQSTKYRTVTVSMDGYRYEVTTYRSDRKYSDHRHPETKVTKTLKQDVRRRDFTINALCLDSDLNVIDYNNGLVDLKKKIIRTVGSPIRRLSEDALRIFRAFRFASRLDFEIDKDTMNAIRINIPLLKYISKERVRTELTKTLGEPHFKKVLPTMLDAGLFKVYPDILEAAKVLNRNYIQVDLIELITIASYIKGSVTDEILLSRKEIKQINQTIEYIKIFESRTLSKKSLLDVSMECIESAMKIMNVFHNSIYTLDEVNDLLKEMPISSSKELDINGFDIKKAFKLEDSPLIKKYLDMALDVVVGGYCQNKKTKITKYLKENRIDE